MDRYLQLFSIAYVRGVNGEDLSYFIKQVHFILHSSFINNDRVVSTHPFELSAAGWGEFEMKIRIVFKDPSERPVEFPHFLRLFPLGKKVYIEQPVVSEYYDEFIFNEPTESFYEIYLFIIISIYLII